MSAHQGHLPGPPARNGMPLPRNYYTYRGTGHDHLTPDMNAAQLAYDIEQHEGTPYTGYDTTFSPEGNGRKPGWTR